LIIIIKTQEDLYRETSEIIRVLSEYRCLKYRQVIRLFPNKPAPVIRSIISRMIKQKRIVYDGDSETLRYFGETKQDYDRSLIAAFWVLLDIINFAQFRGNSAMAQELPNTEQAEVDFINRVDYHSPSEYPVRIAFFMNNDLYEIICVEYDKENIVNYALSPKNPKQKSNKIIVVDYEEQIPKIKAEDIICFCIAGDNGDIAYYDMK